MSEPATARLLDYYQHTAEAADRYLTRRTRPATTPVPAPAALPDIRGRDQAPIPTLPMSRSGKRLRFTEASVQQMQRV